MRHHVTRQPGPAARAAAPGPAAAAPVVDASARGEALRRVGELAQDGPAAVAQRRLLDGLFGPAPRSRAARGTAVVQRAPELDDTHVQADTSPQRIAGSANRVYRIRYGEQGSRALGAAVGYFKPMTTRDTADGIGIYDAEQVANTLATGRLAEHLQMPVARERLAAHEAEGRPWEGTVSAEAPGARALREGNEPRDVDLSQPLTQKGLSDLQLFDALVGQSDRRGENILVGEDGAVTGIDEEATLGFGVDFGRRPKAGRRAGVEDPDDGRGHDKYLGLPALVDVDTAERILALRADALATVINGKDGYRLPAASRFLLVQRLERVQAHVRRLRDEDRLVRAWNEDTYRRAAGEPMVEGPFGSALPRNYIARHLAERRAAGHAGLPAAPAIEAAPISPARAVSEALGRDIDTRVGHAIPQTIHRFWTGGPMSPAAFHNLARSADATAGTRFSQTLWYSTTVENLMQDRGMTTLEQAELRQQQRGALAGLGYALRPIEDLATPEPAPPGFWSRLRGDAPAPAARMPGSVTRADIDIMAGKAVAAIQRGGDDRYDELKHFSDMARLLYLHALGGHHFDVDIGLGDMDLDRQYFHNDPDGNVPLLGSVVAVSRDPIAGELRRLRPSPTRSLRGPDGIHPDAVAVARHARDVAGMLNAMIASRAGNPHVAAAIERLRPDAIAPHVGTMPSGMTVNSLLVHGPGGAPQGNAQARDAANTLTVPPYLLDIEHLTEDSDNR